MAFTVEAMRARIETRPYCFVRGCIVSTGDGEGVYLSVDMAREKVCARGHCLARFSDRSMGSWQCCYHPGERDDATGAYSCCNSQERGCVRADHYAATSAERYPGCTSTKDSDWKPAYRINKEFLKFLLADPLPEAVRKTDNDNEVLILRVDPHPQRYCAPSQQ